MSPSYESPRSISPLVPASGAKTAPNEFWTGNFKRGPLPPFLKLRVENITVEERSAYYDDLVDKPSKLGELSNDPSSKRKEKAGFVTAKQQELQRDRTTGPQAMASARKESARSCEETDSFYSSSQEENSNHSGSDGDELGYTSENEEEGMQDEDEGHSSGFMLSI
ncbi:hypothetical protein BP6252_13162 [Coleophoma cylindrospora]|uniref:Uncharacterized protein n=1 Tax=Coleophoma cylindrospora TaxID=1849047 RepID=A0A3D8QA36_9HELO|nr:hypothetical protein BP6252_13162 [Coleophoma cylindrospora]